MDDRNNNNDLPNSTTFETKQQSDKLKRLNEELQSDLDRIREFIIKVKTKHIELTNENEQLHETVKKLRDELETAKRLLEQK